MRRWIHKIQMILGVILCLLLSAFPAWAAVSADAGSGSRRVFDEADLLTDTETVELEQTVEALKKTMNMDVVLVTTDTTGGKSTQDYADDTFDESGFGMGKDAGGVLFLIDMEHRQIYVSTSGAMIRYLTDSRIDKILDNAFSYAANSDYAGMMRQFLNDMEGYYKKGIPGGQYNYNTETGEISRHRSIGFLEAFLALAVSVFCGAGACLNVKREYAMKQERKQASNFNMAYRANANFVFRDPSDILAGSNTTQAIIPRSTGGGGSGGGFGGGSGGGRSSTHTSGSGRSHGGGGRGF